MLKVFKSLNILLFSFTILFSQTSDQIKSAKGYIEKSGMSKNEVIKAAKSEDTQIVKLMQQLKKLK